MSGQIQTRHLFFHSQNLLVGQLRHVRQRRLAAVRQVALIEKAELAIQIAPLRFLQPIQHQCRRFQHLSAVGAQPVQCAATDQAVQGAAIKLPMAHHAAAERIKPGERAVLLAVTHQLANQRAAQISDRQQTKANMAVHHGERRLAFVDRRRQHPYPQPLTLSDVGGHLAVIQCTGEQCRHVLTRIFCLQEGSLIGHHRIRGGVRFVKGVRSKGRHLLENRFTDRLRHAAANTSLHRSRAVFVR